MKLGLAIGIEGLFNIQFIVDENDEVSVIEVNPRSSRSVPFLSKATGVPMANIATKVMLGRSLKDQGYATEVMAEKNLVLRQEPDVQLLQAARAGRLSVPEMKSTGEAIGYDDSLNRALYKSLQASNMRVVNYGTVLVTLADQDKDRAIPLVRRFYDLGFNIEATSGTAKFESARHQDPRKEKNLRRPEEILDSIRKGHVTYILNTLSSNDSRTSKDGYQIRRCAVETT